MKAKLTLGLSFLLLFVGIAVSENREGGQVKVFNVQKGDYENIPLVNKTEEEWKAILTPEQFKVTRKEATERPHQNEYNNNKRKGVYKCIGCDIDLFLSEDKFDSGTGWPSFTKPIAPENVSTKEDNHFFGRRVEVHCPRCGAHFGHVFDDGPAPTGKRFCMNSAALKFIETTEK